MDQADGSSVVARIRFKRWVELNNKLDLHYIGVLNTQFTATWVIYSFIYMYVPEVMNLYTHP